MFIPKIHDEYLLVNDSNFDREAFLAKINDSNINLIDDSHENKTLLHMAIFKGDITTALALIRKGADCFIQDSNKLTAINYAVKLGIEPLLYELLKLEYLDPNETDSIGSTPLYYAVCIGNINLIKLWLKLGADVYAVNDEGESIIQAANNLRVPDTFNIMRLLFKWGIGIRNDLTNIMLFDTITEGCLILNSYKDGELITSETPGCSKAFTTDEQLKVAVLSHAKNINIVCKSCIFERHLADPMVAQAYKLLNNGLYNLNSKLLFFINDHPDKIKSPEFLPDALKEEVVTPNIFYIPHNK